MSSVASGGRPALQLAEYLERLPGTTLKRLYQQPSAAFAIFRRMLSPLAKSLLMKLLYMPNPMLLSDLDIMIKPEAKRLKDQALSSLRTLHMVQISAPSKDRPQEINLTSNFKTSLRLVLEGGGTHNSFGVPSTLPVPPENDIASLDRYARRKREDTLHFVVSSVAPSQPRSNGSDTAGGGPNKDVRDLLIAGRLVERRPDVRGYGITQAGFTFLLQEPNAQIWTLLLLWLEMMDSPSSSGRGQAGAPAGLDPVDMLAFLFMLSTTELGRAYDSTALSEERRNMIPFLVDLGLIYVPSHKPQQYFPTRLATTLTSSASSLRGGGAGLAAATNAALKASSSSLTDQQVKGSVIIETNFRLYAYTSSPLQIAVLSLFSDLKMRFPDMVAGKLSRSSIHRAIAYGITADQIVSYLAAHAHEQMHRAAAAQNRPVLPPTVVDQIRLWQLENERMKTTSGFLFKDFDNFKEYVAVAGYADEVGVLVWRSDQSGMFFASKHEQIRDFMKLRKKT